MSKKHQEFMRSKLARFRLEGCRNSLKQKYPEFIYPLNKLQFVERKHGVSNPYVSGHHLSTDGLHIYYSPYHTIAMKRSDTEYEIMHIVLHGILGHFLCQQNYPKHDIRDPIMDFQVEQFALLLGMSTPFSREYSHQVSNVLSAKDSTLKYYYHYIQNPQEIHNLKKFKCMAADDHKEWDYREKLQELTEQMEEFIETHREEIKKFWQTAQANFIDLSGMETDSDSPEQLLWKHISDRLQQYGSYSGGSSATVQFSGKSIRNYRELLKELFSVREIVKEQPDSIDPMFYYYGFELYEDVPLIEPLEYEERPAPGLIVIAVDVSGSCSDRETMETFWRETYDCISQMRDTDSDGEILILQCDTAIKKEERVLLSEFDKPPENIQARGFGGTSFLPVFRRVEELTKEDIKVDAILYLTDGDGAFPETPSTVPTYFILPKSNFQRNQSYKYIPDWIETIPLEDTTC